MLKQIVQMLVYAFCSKANTTAIRQQLHKNNHFGRWYNYNYINQFHVGTEF